jgi:hypothetical protein
MMNGYSFDETLFRLFHTKDGQEAQPEKTAENKAQDTTNNPNKDENESKSDKTINHTK